MDRKRQIMEAAANCFAEKGYNTTSIQDIADRLEMAKGSLYFYFRSKEDLLVSICKHYIGLYLKTFREAAANTELSPRERLARQVHLSFEQYAEHREFITLFMKERFEVNEEIRLLMLDVRAESLRLTMRLLVELYGEKAKPYAYDATVMFQSMIQGYLGLVLLNSEPLDERKLADYLLERMDDLVFGMQQSDKPPVLSYDRMELVLSNTCINGSQQNEEAFAELERMRGTLEQLDMEPGVLAEIRSALQLLDEEFAKAGPQPVVVKGLIALLRSKKIRGWKRPLDKLEASM